jgi:ATP-dependent helicase Lhr and Lhr-like helicase
VQWWTYAGGRINRTLKYGLECLWGWEVRADNFQVTISGEHLTPAMFDSAIAEVTKPEFWQAKSMQEYLLANLPNYRFSKFQQVLPDRYALEMVQGYLLDIEGISKLMIDSPQSVQK